MVPLTHIQALKDTVVRARKSARQMVRVAEGAAKVVADIQEQYENEFEILDAQEQAIDEFLAERQQ